MPQREQQALSRGAIQRPAGARTQMRKFVALILAYICSYSLAGGCVERLFKHVSVYHADTYALGYVFLN
jgi:hypothetical protein